MLNSEHKNESLNNAVRRSDGDDLQHLSGLIVILHAYLLVDAGAAKPYLIKDRVHILL